MKLNPDCIRDILITVEEHSDFTHLTEYKAEDPYETLSDYSPNEVLYHIMQCTQFGLIHGVHYYDGGKHTDIRDLTPAGHEFLANIRNNPVWKKTLAKGAGASLPVLIEIAKDIALKHFLG